jgi:hypothetical protein
MERFNYDPPLITLLYNMLCDIVETHLYLVLYELLSLLRKRFI